MRNLIYLSFFIAFLFFILMNFLLFTGTSYLVNSYEKRSMSRLTVNVRNQCTILANNYMLSENRTSSKDKKSQKNAGRSEISQLADDIGGRILIIDNRLNVLEDTYNIRKGDYLLNPDIIHALKGETPEYKDVGSDYIQVITPIRSLDNGKIYGAVIALASVDDKNTISAFLQDQGDTIMGIFLLVSFIFSILFWFLINQAFRRLQLPLENIATGHTDVELPSKGFREFTKLSETINRIMTRANDTERAQQEFVSNVSHELKTPITSMKILADSLLTQKDAPVELYQEFMTDIVQEIDRENQIITDLLTLVKMDKADSGLNISTVNINELLEVLLKRISPIAAQRNITIRLETMREVVAEVDEVKIAVACNNLIVNAVKYNYDDGLVSVSLNADHKFFYIRVKDTGCGIPEDAQEMIFERFYRVDKDRSRETGGTGLGLAITRKVLLMHKGSIRVHSREGEGTTFTIRVPLTYVA